MIYKHITETVVARIDTDGLSRLSCTIENPEYLQWLSEGNTPEPADLPPEPTYQELRAAAYPPIGDQLDAMWKGGEDETAMKETILAVKSEYPKA